MNSRTTALITPAELTDRLTGDTTPTLVDVRTPASTRLRLPEARFLAGGIGAGLATAAVTDTCAMGAALARLLPHNCGGRAVTLPDAVQALRAPGDRQRRSVTVAIVLGLVTGALVGLLGGGGSFLAVPALVYAAGQDLPQAVATSLLVVGITASVALLPRLGKGRIAWRIALLFGAAGIALVLIVAAGILVRIGAGLLG